MDSFLEYVTKSIYTKHGSFKDLVFVVPSVRSATYLKQYFAKVINTPIISPTVWSIENFIQEISQLKKTSNTELVFRLYQCYLNSGIKEKDDFFSFNRWAQTLLADFDELDRYLIETEDLFDYLTAVSKINAWGKENGTTDLVNDYVKFTQTFKPLYNAFTQDLLETKDSYQGLRYKKACENIQSYLNKTKGERHIFIGFNALNKAEEFLIQTILDHSESHIYWDLDEYFLNDPLHDARYFIHQHKTNWPYFTDKTLNGISNHFLLHKNIEITGIPKNLSQAKFIGTLLTKLHEQQSFKKPIALVLADESLLPVILNAIPSKIRDINITMGYPLGETSISNFFYTLIDFYINKSNGSWYFKDILRLISNPISAQLFGKEENTLHTLTEKILKNNYVYLNEKDIDHLIGNENPILNKLFPPEPLNAKAFIELCLDFTNFLKQSLTRYDQLIEFESSHLFFKLFNQLSKYVEKFDYLKDLKALRSIMIELIALEKLNFQGSTTDGLQIMGMLESRTLDFETVIMTSVNEGVLPAGKSNNSFIPYDVKKEYRMPTFKDKDAVYTYHFYRLLQRAKNVHLTYNTEHDVLEGGEKSRFITQLMTDPKLTKVVSHKIAVPDTPSNLKAEKKIDKTPELINQIKEVCLNGFSPTSLTNYIKNPYGFYKRHILKIKDSEYVEETIANNTFGTIVHDSLEDLYSPFIGKVLTKDVLTPIKKNIENVVRKNFTKTYSDKNLDHGQNLIVFKVITKYVQASIEFELQQVEKHQIKILALEKDLKIQLDIPELNFPVYLKGKIDRIDEIDGQLRIIDYKTGKVISSELEISSFDQLTRDDKKAKAFQLLCYSLLYNYNHKPQPICAGILPIKSLKSGILNFAFKSDTKPVIKNNLIDDETIQQFKLELKHLIFEIVDPKVPFNEIVI